MADSQSEGHAASEEPCGKRGAASAGSKRSRACSCSNPRVREAVCGYVGELRANLVRAREDGRPRAREAEEEDRGQRDPHGTERVGHADGTLRLVGFSTTQSLADARVDRHAQSARRLIPEAGRERREK